MTIECSTSDRTPFLLRNHDCRTRTVMSLFVKCLHRQRPSRLRWWRTISTSECCTTSRISRSQRSCVRNCLTSSNGVNSGFSTNGISFWVGGPTLRWHPTLSIKLHWTSSRPIRKYSSSWSKPWSAFSVSKDTITLIKNLALSESNLTAWLMLTITTSRIWRNILAWGLTILMFTTVSSVTKPTTTKIQIDSSIVRNGYQWHIGLISISRRSNAFKICGWKQSRSKKCGNAELK